MGLNKRRSHLTCKIANKCLNNVSGWNLWRRIKMVPSLLLLSCETPVSVKENSDRKKEEIGIHLRHMLIMKTAQDINFRKCICNLL